MYIDWFRRNGKRCRRRDKCHNDYKEPHYEHHQDYHHHHHYHHDHYVPVYHHYSSYWSQPSYGWSSSYRKKWFYFKIQLLYLFIVYSCIHLLNTMHLNYKIINIYHNKIIWRRVDDFSPSPKIESLQKELDEIENPKTKWHTMYNLLFSCESSSRNANVCQSVSLSFCLSINLWKIGSGL